MICQMCFEEETQEDSTLCFNCWWCNAIDDVEREEYNKCDEEEK